MILAEGLPCESYLDTGNRSAFTNGGTTAQLHPDFAMRIWETSGCSPLVLDGPKHAAARAVLLAQAERLGHTLTEDPALRVLGDGRELAVRVLGRRRHVSIPDGVAAIQLISRTWIPAHSRSHDRDTRRLGVAVSRLWIDEHEASIESPRLFSGWHTPETDWRWTDGSASIHAFGARALVVDIAMTGTYWERQGVSETNARIA